jgi:hypothetical protein
LRRNLSLKFELDVPAKLPDEEVHCLVLGKVERKAGRVMATHQVALGFGPVVKYLPERVFIFLHLKNVTLNIILYFVA